MLSVRRNVFETNSSSTHSITMCSENEYDEWEKGELLFDRWKNGFITKVEYQKEYERQKKEYFEEKPDETDEDFEDYFNDDKRYYTYDEFFSEIGYETHTKTYTTKGGETVIALCYYGNGY